MDWVIINTPRQSWDSEIISGIVTTHDSLSNLAFADSGHTGFQAQGDVLDDLNTLGAVASDSEFLVGTGAGTLAWESGATVRTSLGLGTGDSPQFTGGTFTGSLVASGNNHYFGDGVSKSRFWSNAGKNYILSTNEAGDASAILVFAGAGGGVGEFQFVGHTFIDNTGLTAQLACRSYLHSDEAGGGGSIHFQREQSGGEQSHAAAIFGVHEGTGDDELGTVVIQTNTGAGLVTGLTIDSNLDTTLAGKLSATNYTAANLLTACGTNAGTLDFSAASKTLTVEDDAIVSQDYSPDADVTFNDLTLSAPSNIYALSHDSFADFVANEHINHTSVSIIAGTGLTGGGDISSSRTLSVDGLLEDLDALGANSADSEFLVGTGAGTLAWESGATVRTSLGLGTGDDVEFQSLLIDQNTDAIGLKIESAATTDTNYGLSIITSAGAMVAEFLNGNGNAGMCYLGLNSNNAFSGTYFFGRNLTAASTDCPVVYMVQDHADDDQPLLELVQNGSGAALLVTSGSISIAEGVTISSGVTVPDSGYIGSVSESQAIQIEADGDIVFHQAIDVPSDIVCGGHVIFDVDNGHIGYFDNSPILTFNNTDDQVEITGILTVSSSASITGAITAANYTAANLLTACATNAGALDFSAASKTLTVEDTAIVSQDYSSDASPTFGGLVIANGGTIGQAAGPLLTFDDTNNYLEITGCNLGLGTTTPGTLNAVELPGLSFHIDNDIAPSRILIEGAQPEFFFWESDAAADAKGIIFYGAAGVFTIARVKDDTTPGATALSIAVDGTCTFGNNIVMADGKTIGQVAGPLLTFDDTNNYLELTGCQVCIGMSSADSPLSITTEGVGTREDLLFFKQGAASDYGYKFQIDNQVTGNLFLQRHELGAEPATEFWTFSASGCLGINDAAPAEYLDVGGNANVTGVYKVDDVQVVSNQGAAVADSTDAESVILRLNELLARCRAHGLIAT